MAGHDKAWWRPVGRGRIPLWIKALYSLLLCVLVPVYSHQYDLTNFLWACNIALFIICAALWLENPLLTSMMAIGVLPFELAWTMDLVSGARLLGMASYMFDPGLPLYLRGFSLYHTVMPPLMIFMVYRLGYDRRALLAQSLLVWLVLPLTYLIIEPAENINVVFGLGKEPQTFLHPLFYLALEMILVPLVICLPVHLLLQRLVGHR